MSKITRLKKPSHYVHLDKTCLNDERLSWQAKGMHAYLMGLPNDWKVYVKDLKSRARNGRDAVRNILNELQKFGYVSTENIRDTKGKIVGLNYIVFEAPIVNECTEESGMHPCPENPGTDNPSPDFPAPEKPPLINNKLTNYPNNQLMKEASSSKEGFPEEKQCNANDTNVLAAADLLIGNDLTANQRQHIISQLNTFAKDSSIAKDGTFSAMGIDTVADIIGKAMLDPQQFKRCKTFEHKIQSILGEIGKGNFNRIVADVYSADADNQPDTTKPTPEQELQASMKRLQIERQCQVQSLTGPMAQYPDFVSATQACIGKLDQDIADIQSELDILAGASPAQIMAAPDFTADHSAQGGS